MTFFGASDVPALMRDAGVVVTVGLVSTRGLEDTVDDEMLRETAPDLIGKVRTVIVQTGILTLASKGSITVDGNAYKIHSIQQIDDGALTRVNVVQVN